MDGGLAPPALSFKEGLAPVKRDGKVGFIDANGVWMMKPAFDYALPFSEGLAAVYFMDEQKWGFINHQGEFAIEPTFHSPVRFKHTTVEANIGSFQEGLAYVGDGFINHNGQYVFRGDFISATNFHDGFARVIQLNYNPKGHASDGVETYVNRQGEIIWSQQLPYIQDIIHQAAKYGGYNFAFYEANQ